MPYQAMEKPVRRSVLRSRLGLLYYGALRRFLWIRMSSLFASERSDRLLPCVCFSHRTPLLRRLKDVDMWMHATAMGMMCSRIPTGRSRLAAGRPVFILMGI